MKAVYAQLDDHIKNYETGTITISDDSEFSMRKTVRTMQRVARISKGKQAAFQERAGESAGQSGGQSKLVTERQHLAIAFLVSSAGLTISDTTAYCSTLAPSASR